MKVAAGLDNPLAAAFGSAMDGFGEVVEMTDPVLSEAAASSNPMEAAFAGGLLESQQAPTLIQTATPPSPPPSAAPGPPTGPPPSTKSGGPPGPPPS